MYYKMKIVKTLNEKLIIDQNTKKKLKNAKIFILKYYPKAVNCLNSVTELECKFNFYDKKSTYYLSKIYCNLKNGKSLVVFINCNSFDICCYNGYVCQYKTLTSVHYDIYDVISFIKMIITIMSKYNK